MSKDLAGNVSSGCDFEAGGDHFKGGPMSVSDKVSDELFRSFGIELIGWIGYSGAECDQVLCVL